MVTGLGFPHRLSHQPLFASGCRPVCPGFPCRMVGTLFRPEAAQQLGLLLQREPYECRPQTSMIRSNGAHPPITMS
jgi:hypothetical protein